MCTAQDKSINHLNESNFTETDTISRRWEEKATKLHLQLCTRHQAFGTRRVISSRVPRQIARELSNVRDSFLKVSLVFCSVSSYALIVFTMNRWPKIKPNSSERTSLIQSMSFPSTLNEADPQNRLAWALFAGQQHKIMFGCIWLWKNPRPMAAFY